MTHRYHTFALVVLTLITTIGCATRNVWRNPVLQARGKMSAPADLDEMCHPDHPKPRPDAAAMVAEVEQSQGPLNEVAKQRLLDDLNGTDPELWPQVVASFKSSLAYRQKYVTGETAIADTRTRQAPKPKRNRDVQLMSHTEPVDENKPQRR